MSQADGWPIRLQSAFSNALLTTTDPNAVLRGFDAGLDDNEGAVTFESTADEAAGLAGRDPVHIERRWRAVMVRRVAGHARISDRFRFT